MNGSVDRAIAFKTKLNFVAQLLSCVIGHGLQSRDTFLFSIKNYGLQKILKA
jgi:hypothetical protein